jgi:diadenosine tetraphosphate (Ap4A) HIT family hydrolase
VVGKPKIQKVKEKKKKKPKVENIGSNKMQELPSLHVHLGSPPCFW